MTKRLLVFGENPNDCKAVAAILNAWLGDGYRAQHAAKPPIFAANASGRKAKKLADRVADTANLLSKKCEVAAVVIHRDCDQCEPAHIQVAKAIKGEFGPSSKFPVIPAVPAWELETWLMCFPRSLKAFRGCWREINLKGKNPGKFKNSKEQLRRLLRSKDKSCRDYSESDAPNILILIAESGESVEAAAKISASLRLLLNEARKVCE
jgi:hypothetical protein